MCLMYDDKCVTSECAGRGVCLFIYIVRRVKKVAIKFSAPQKEFVGRAIFCVSIDQGFDANRSLVTITFMLLPFPTVSSG